MPYSWSLSDHFQVFCEVTASSPPPKCPRPLYYFHSAPSYLHSLPTLLRNLSFVIQGRMCIYIYHHHLILSTPLFWFSMDNRWMKWPAICPSPSNKTIKLNRLPFSYIQVVANCKVSVFFLQCTYITLLLFCFEAMPESAQSLLLTALRRPHGVPEIEPWLAPRSTLLLWPLL